MPTKKDKNTDIIDIIKGIQNVKSTMGFDGAMVDGKPADIGLEREKEYKVTEKRKMDGFGITFSGNVLLISYQCEIQLKDVYENNKFESEVEQRIEDIASFIKKKYKVITGDALTLKRTKDEVKVLVQRTSNIRAWVQAQAAYTIGGVDIPTEDEDKKRFDKKFKQWMDDAEKKGKKPSNVKISEKDNQKEEK